MNRSHVKAELGRDALTAFGDRLASQVARPLPRGERPARESASQPNFAENTEALGLFFRFCRNAATRRQRDGRDRWNLEEWQAFVARGRAAFGPGPRALWGDLTLVETMLEHGLTAEQIGGEMAQMRARRLAADHAREEREAREKAASERRARQIAVQEATEKEMIRLEARAVASDRAQQLKIATPRAATRRLTSIAGEGT